MADFNLLLEAERRGILPPAKATLLAEARKRGLVPALDAPKADPGIDPGLPLPKGTEGRAKQDEYWRGQGVDPNAPPKDTPYRFGTSMGADPNPLPAIGLFGSELASHIPVAGPALKQIGNNVDAWASGMSPLEIDAANAEMAQNNPEVATAGRMAGPIATYIAASRIPGGARALGMEGPWLQRVALGGASAEAIGTADRVAHGESVQDAAVHALPEAGVSAGLSILGRNPDAIAPERAAANEVLRREGVPLTAGQELGNKGMRYKESQLGGVAAENFADRQGSAYTSAVLKNAGVDAQAATPEVMDKAFTDIGKQFEDMASITPVPFDQKLQDDMLKAVDDYQNVAGQVAPIVEKMMNRAGELAAGNGGVLQGQAYQNLRSEIGSYIKQANGETKGALIELQSALDDAVERNLSPLHREAWGTVRNRYRNLLVAEDAVSRAGEKAVNGIITPANLRLATKNIYGKRGYVRGKGDLNDLGRAGVTAMTPLPDSGTASRMLSASTPALGVGAVGTAAMGAAQGNIPMALGGLAGLGALAAPKALGRMMLSEGGRDFLTGRSALRSTDTQAFGRAAITSAPSTMSLAAWMSQN